MKIKPEQIIEIIPMNEGFQYENKMINRDKLKQIILQKKENIKNCVLFIRMKPKIKYERLVDTLSVARETKLKRISLKNGEEK